ncbi:MAG: DUF342 domain-containing protein [Spirochaetales bacterium]|nr:DUF342 domain-containing protein [Spirochaetales bacterium]
MNFAKRLFKKTEKDADTPPRSGAAPSQEKKPGIIGRENWHVSVTRDRVTALLDYVPRADRLAPVAAELLRAARELGIAEDGLFSEEKLSNALKNAETSGVPLRGYPICEDSDGGFDISISDDKLKATLSLRKGRGNGAPFDLKELGKALRASNIKGLNFDKLKTDILMFYRGPALSLEGYELAAGKMPESGGDQKLQWEIEFMPGPELEEIKTRPEGVPDNVFEGIASLEQYPIDIVENAALVGKETLIATVTDPQPGKNGVDVYGNSIPAPAGTATPLELHENCAKRDTKIYSEIDGILDKWDVETTSHIRVRPHSDARVTVCVAADGMSASVDLIQGTGYGKRLLVEDVKEALSAAGVVRGIDLEAVGAAVKAADEEGAVEQAVVAKGQEPQAAGDAALIFHIDLASGKAVTLRGDGRADFKNQDRFTTVETGTLIAEVATAETQLREGFDVNGNIIGASEAEDFTLEIGENVKQERDEQGRLKLIAKVSGELVYDGKSIDIVGVHVIKGDVGPATGNIRFSGPVHVTGNVLPGFFVVATGDIKIAAGVEAALASSEKSVHVSQGIIGGGKAAVRARENITAGFAEHVILMAVQDITLKNACLQCTVKCNGKLTLAGEKGHLMGGETKARYGIEVTNLGSRNGVKTSVSFGQDYLIGDRIELEEKELEKLKETAVRTDLKIRQAEREGGVEELKKGRARKLQLLKSIERRTERLFWLREKFEQHFEGEVAVRGTAFPGVTLESHGRLFEVAREMGKVVFYFNREKGIIENRPL